MRYTDIDINFDITCEGHQNWPKICYIDILSVLVTIMCDVKVDVNICEHQYVNLVFCEPPPSPAV